MNSLGANFEQMKNQLLALLLFVIFNGCGNDNSLKEVLNKAEGNLIIPIDELISPTSSSIFFYTTGKAKYITYLNRKKELIFYSYPDLKIDRRIDLTTDSIMQDGVILGHYVLNDSTIMISGQGWKVMTMDWDGNIKNSQMLRFQSEIKPCSLAPGIIGSDMRIEPVQVNDSILDICTRNNNFVDNCEQIKDQVISIRINFFDSTIISSPIELMGKLSVK